MKAQDDKRYLKDRLLIEDISDQELERDLEKSEWQKSNPAYPSLIWVLLITNIVTIIFLINSRPSWPWSYHDSQLRSSYPRTSPLPKVYTKFAWRSTYASDNTSEASEAWSSMIPSHGIIAVPSTWATSQNWPASMSLPDSSPPKSVYLLEAYHQLHCLKTLRTSFIQASTPGLNVTAPSHHINHCFDLLRQNIQCHADALPLYSFGKGVNGLGQTHECRNWDRLSKFARENSACYRDDVDMGVNGTHFGICGDEDLGDGLPSIFDLAEGDLGP